METRILFRALDCLAWARKGLRTALPHGHSSAWLIGGLLLSMQVACKYSLGATTGGGTAPPPAMTLSYSTPAATYQKGVTIPANTPTTSDQVSGGFTVSPALPPGLLLDPSSGVISGTPTAPISRSWFNISASTVRGPAGTQVSIAVHDVASMHLNTPRSGHLASLLLDGRVLFVGGWDAGYFTIPEVYDPASRTFSDTGRQTSSRNDYTATVLPSGKVLIAGGLPDLFAGGDFLAAELFDPASGTFAVTGNLNQTRTDATATLMLNGKVLLAGGDAGKTAEIYDPSTGSFTRTGDTQTNRRGHSATLLQDGRLLVLGGVAGLGYLATAECYDPSTGTFSPTGSVVTARYDYSATLLTNGKVLIAGGRDNQGNLLNTSEVYDPATGTFAASGALGTGRSGHTATRLMDGKVLFAGGAAASAELYNPATGTFNETGAMAGPRDKATATLLLDGTVLITGGTGATYGVALDSAEIYDPVSGTFRVNGP